MSSDLECDLQSSLQLFGGDWTSEKLERVRKYLAAYVVALKRQGFHLIYIDAFAGTGYRTLKRDENQSELLLPDLAQPDSQHFANGSARIALEIQPRFNEYIFIEKDPARCSELESTKTEFPSAASDILVINADANAYLKQLCRETEWMRRRRRAVLFLDPFGMQVEWDTIVSIANTKAIDLWLLFPLGIGVNRLLRRDGNIDSAFRSRLDSIFGTTDWFDAFYQTYTAENLFGSGTQIRKVSDFHTIERYFVERLRTVFAGVADNPLPLYNSRNNPLYLLCFASSNPKGAPTAIHIAEHVLGKRT